MTRQQSWSLRLFNLLHSNTLFSARVGLGSIQREGRERKRTLFTGHVKSTDRRGKQSGKFKYMHHAGSNQLTFSPQISRLFWNTVLGSFSLLLLFSLAVSDQSINCKIPALNMLFVSWVILSKKLIFLLFKTSNHRQKARIMNNMLQSAYAQASPGSTRLKTVKHYLFCLCWLGQIVRSYIS